MKTLHRKTSINNLNPSTTPSSATTATAPSSHKARGSVPPPETTSSKHHQQHSQPASSSSFFNLRAKSVSKEPMLPAQQPLDKSAKHKTSASSSSSSLFAGAPSRFL